MLESQRQFVVYEWSPWPRPLIYGLMPDTVRIRAKVREPAEHVLRQVPPDTKYFLFHIDLTKAGNLTGDRAELVEALERRGVEVLNAAVTDVSKKTIQAICRRSGLNVAQAEQAGDPDELLMVKSDLNCGGVSERPLSKRLKSELQVPDLPDIIRHMTDYKVMPRRDVPMEWWMDSGLVMERFIGNKANRYWRCYLFLDRLALSEVLTPAPVKKGNVVVQRMNSLLRITSSGFVTEQKRCDIPAPALEQAIGLSRAVGLHFGAVDVVGDDQENYYAIDVATTPGEPTFPIPRVFEHLRAAVGVTVRAQGGLSAMRSRLQADWSAKARRWMWRHF